MIERATLALQQLPAKPRPPQTISRVSASARRTRSAKRPTSDSALVSALSETAIAEKKAFLNRKIRDVVSVLLDDAPKKKKERRRKTEEGRQKNEG
jgi:hypothetical protein